MYLNLYDEVMVDSCSDARSREREVLERSAGLLRNAMQQNRYSQEAVAAIFFTGKIWRALLADLASPDNQLDEGLRSQIISVGLWILKQCETCRLTRSIDFLGIIEVNSIIGAGLA